MRCIVLVHRKPAFVDALQQAPRIVVAVRCPSEDVEADYTRFCSIVLLWWNFSPGQAISAVGEGKS